VKKWRAWKFSYNNLAKPTLEERKKKLENELKTVDVVNRHLDELPPDYALHKLLPFVSLPICQWLRSLSSLFSARVKDFRKCYPM
jgi:hypothetical protein